jgi:hypothetical protein
MFLLMDLGDNTGADGATTFAESKSHPDLHCLGHLEQYLQSHGVPRLRLLTAGQQLN